MKRTLKYLFLSVVLFVFINELHSQRVVVDSSFMDKFPTLVGSISFDTDSIDIIAGEVGIGSSETYRVNIKNVGNYPVAFTNGKSNNFISVNFEPPLLNSMDEGVMVVSFEALADLDTGMLVSEVSIISNDRLNPYKYLNLYTTIIPGKANYSSAIMDTVPNIVFDHYNYDFGHHNHGRKFFHTFLITNFGSQPLLINNIEVPREVEIVDAPVGMIMPGEKRILRVKVSTRGRTGIQHYIISVYSNDPSDPVVMLGLHGSVKILPDNKKTSVQCESSGKQRL